MRASAMERESREFAVSVDGKVAGQYRMTIVNDGKGKTVMSAEGDLQAKLLVFKYRYTYRGTETWAGDRLQSLECESIDQGKQTRVSAVADSTTCRISVNGRARSARPCAWTTTYWRLPPAEQMGGPIPAVDVDTGEDVTCRLRYVERSPLRVGESTRDCSHYHLEGGVPAELWFDASGRLVRQQWVEDGHATELMLRKLE